MSRRPGYWSERLDGVRAEPMVPASWRVPRRIVLWIITVGVGLLALFAFEGCAAPASSAFVRSERATYEHVAHRYLLYVDGDPELGPSDRAAEHRIVRGWERALLQAEKAAAESAK